MKQINSPTRLHLGDELIAFCIQISFLSAGRNLINLQRRWSIFHQLDKSKHRINRLRSDLFRLFQMTNKDAGKKTGYVESVKILDVEKRYRSGPKHYVTRRRHSFVLFSTVRSALGFRPPSQMGQSVERFHHLSTLRSILRSSSIRSFRLRTND